ncbi:MAG: outer membrane protein assembly factor BamD [Planctomycetota bacterium]
MRAFGAIVLLALPGCLFGSGAESRITSATEGIRLADSAFEGDRYDEADELYEAMQDRYPDVFPEEVLFKRARANFLSGDYGEAFALYDRLADEFFSNRYADQMIADEFVIGQKYLDGEIRWLGIFPRRSQGVKVFHHIMTHWPRSSAAEEARRLLAEYYFEDGAYADAIAEYLELRKKYPSSRWKPVYDYRYAVSLRMECKGVDYDRGRLEAARLAFLEYLDAWRPTGHTFVKSAETQLAELEEMLGEKEYRIGGFYEWFDEPLGAAVHYEKAIQRYPRTEGAKASAEALSEVEEEMAEEGGDR